MNKTAIAFFAYNRPEHTKATLDALTKSDGATALPLFLFCDGARPEDSAEVEKTRAILAGVRGFSRTELIFREQNLGCGQAVWTGIDEVLGEFDRIIVIEDDIVVSQPFIGVMTRILDRYEEEKQVFGATGSADLALARPALQALTEGAFFFARRTGSSGWCTWKDRWKLMADTRAIQRIKTDRRLQRALNIGCGPDMSLQIQLDKHRLIDAWDIYWTAIMFLNKGVFLYPCDPYVDNIGFDGSGLHSGRKARCPVDFEHAAPHPHLPEQIELDHRVMDEIRAYYGISAVRRFADCLLFHLPASDLRPFRALRRLFN